MVGIMMVHGFNNNKGLPLFMPSRVIKARYRMVRIFLSALVCMIFLSTAPAGAIETTKASALVTEEMRAVRPLSFTKSSPLAQADVCLSFLHAARLSPGVSARNGAAQSQTRRPVGKTAVPVALGFFLGVRIALGPREVVKSSKRVQIGPELRTASNGGASYALAIAAYRRCKNEHALNLPNKNNNKR